MKGHKLLDHMDGTHTEDLLDQCVLDTKSAFLLSAGEQGLCVGCAGQRVIIEFCLSYMIASRGLDKEEAHRRMEYIVALLDADSVVADKTEHSVN